jgi:uncharacterized protein YkwD
MLLGAGSARAAAVVLALLACTACSSMPGIGDVRGVFSKAPPDPAAQMQALESRIYELIQDRRHALDSNAKDLALDSELVGVARQRSADMALKNSFADGSTDPHISATRLMAADAKFQGLLGENIAAQHYTKASGIDVEAFARRFLSIWLASPSHKENLSFADYSRTGVGAAVSGDTVYVTELFASDVGFAPHKESAPPPLVSAFPSARAAKASAPPPASLRGSADGAIAAP